MSICNDSPLDTYLAVMSGTMCRGFACVGTNDDGPSTCEGASAITFDTKSGGIYHVLVKGYGDEEGDFRIKIEPANNSNACLCPSP